MSALFVFSDDGEFTEVVEHIGKGFGGEEAPSDERRRGWIPEWVLLFAEDGDDSSFKVIFSHVLDDVIAIGEGVWVPPVAVSYIFVNYLDENVPLFDVDYLGLFVLAVRNHHLHSQRQVLTELFGDEVQLYAFGERLQ